MYTKHFGEKGKRLRRNDPGLFGKSDTLGKKKRNPVKKAHGACFKKRGHNPFGVTGSRRLLGLDSREGD